MALCEKYVMKVLYVAPDVPVPHARKFLGGSTHVLKVAEGLAEKGCEVFIISRRMVGQTKFEKITEKIVTRRFYRGLLIPLEGKPRNTNKRSGFLKLTKLIEGTYFVIYRLILTIYVMWLLSKYRFDIVVERNSAKGIGVFPAWLFRVRSVVEVIDPDLSKVQLRLADRILTYTKDILPKIFQNKVVLTHAGVDVKLFKPIEDPKIRERYGLVGEKVVIYVGELSEWHGADILIDVAEKIEDVKFLMIGKNLELLCEEVKKRGIAEKFLFTGFVEHKEVPKFISAADVAVAPYTKTDKMKIFHFSPIKIFEYMACERPVVASDIEIVRDVIERHKCGLLARQDDVDDFVQKIKILLYNCKLRRKLGRSGRVAVVSEYTWNKVAEKILEGLK